MTAPLPMRFYNPLKDLCQRTNLDYETVIGNCGLSTTTRNALLNAEIPKPIQEYTDEEKKIVKQKISEFNTKYGVEEQKDADKGRERYDMGVTVEHLCPDDGKVDESGTTQDNVQTAEDAKYSKHGIKYLAPPPGYRKWIPGKSN
jgi:hypothetical protein